MVQWWGTKAKSYVLAEKETNAIFDIGKNNNDDNDQK
jgi:hypothetical protein